MSESTANNLDFNQDPAEEADSTRKLLEKEYQVDTADIKNSQGLTYVILDLTVNHMYDRAIRELNAYFEFKSTFPTYRKQTKRLFEHVESVIRAIRTKKTLMSVPSLTASKKKELHSAVVHHFHDLKQALQKVTQIEYQIRISDSRSTMWAVKAAAACAFVIIFVFFFQEIFYTFSATMEVIQSDLVRTILKYLKI